MDKRRLVIMVLTSVLAAGSLLWLQRKFEAGDERNALAIVQGYRHHGRTIPEVIAARHPGRAIAWSTQTENACFQHVQVIAEVARNPSTGSAGVGVQAPDDGAPTLYAFSVDINGPSIHPANEAGRQVLAALAAPSAAAPSAAAPSATPPASTTTPAPSARKGP